MKDSYSDIFGNKNKILFVFSHPDDVEVFAGGTVARLASDDKTVGVVKMTNGNKGSRQNHISLAELAEIRRKEDMNSMKVLGVKDENNFYIDIEDGEVEDSMENIKRLAFIIRKFKPDLIVTHNPENVIIRFDKGVNWVNHRDHINTAKAATYAAYPYSRDLSFFSEQFAEEGVDSHTVTEFLYIDYYGHQDEIGIDVTDFLETRINALKSHVSQISEARALEATEFFTNRLKLERRYETFRHVIAD